MGDPRLRAQQQYTNWLAMTEANRPQVQPNGPIPGRRPGGFRGHAWWKRGADRPGAGPAVAARQALGQPGTFGASYNPDTNQLTVNRAPTPPKQAPAGQPPAAPGVASRVAPGTVPMRRGLR